ncbi:MAG: OB-fold domain-containing protein [Acidimicrobiia bacterium]
MPSDANAPLVQHHTLEFPGGYTRSVGPVTGKFLTGLRDGVFLGNATAAGRVMCPPMEYDPETGENAADTWSECGPGGTVTSFTWITEPKRKHPLQRPFAFALVQLDGADTSILHALDAPQDALSVGMRVTAQFKDERVGHITDIAAFVPEVTS